MSARNSAVTITNRTESAGVFLEVSQNEHLFFTVVLQRGAQPVFTLTESRSDKLLLSHKNPPASANPLTFEREWPTRADTVPRNTTITLGMHFLEAAKYTYKLTHRKADGSSRVLIDMDFESNQATDVFFQDIGITTD